MSDPLGELHRIEPQQLEALLAGVVEDAIEELVLLGPGARLRLSPSDWPDALQGRQVYQLSALVDDLPARLRLLRHLRRLNLWGNGVGDAGARAIAEGLPQLTTLTLSDNRVGDAGARAIAEGLPQLTTLHLARNQVGDAGARAIAEGLQQLTTLTLSNNRVGDAGAPAIAEGLPQLTTLDLSDNGVGDAGARAIAEGLPQLTTLTLWGNRVGEAGAWAIAEGLPQLTTLDLSGNRVGDAGAVAIAEGLPQLTTLHLARNRVGDAGARAIAEGLPQLTTLHLWDNQVGDAGARAIAEGLPQLTTLHLWDNQVGDAGARAIAEGLPQLTTLDLSDNQVGDAGARAIAEGLPQLTTLDLSDNQVGDAGAVAIAEGLPQLTTLDLSDNQVGDAGAWAIAEGLPQLTTLHLSRNHVGDAGARALSALGALTSLDLSGTGVTDLTPFRPLLSAGMTVSLEPSSSRGLSVAYCPIVVPPLEVVQQGREAVLNYFREADAQGFDQLYEAKVLLVGEGGAGKTSLLRRLYFPEEPLPTEDETTKGIDISRQAFELDDGRVFRLNVWDFGGQQIYHATHQFFLTKSSLYILVDDTRKDHKTVHDQGFKYWLEVIETLSDRSPVLIFQNEKGGRSKAIDEVGIRRRFDNVKDFYHGDLNDLHAADGLGRAIEFYVQRLPHVGDEVPAKWVSIRESVEDRAQSAAYVSQQDYFDLYAEHLDFDREKALHLSRYLHDLGVFLHFQDDLWLSQIVILQNHWATEAVFAVLDDETIKGRFGRFSFEDCQRVWDRAEYADKHAELLALMEKFELCYRLVDVEGEAWLAPQLLSPSVPDDVDVEPRPDDLVLTYRYDFLPKGVVNRLMVRLSRFVRRPELSWGSGVVFEQGDTTVLVQETERGNEIVLRARGPERAELRNVIASDLDALNDSFTGLHDKVDKLVPCLCKQCTGSPTPSLFGQRELKRRRRLNRLEIECPQHFHMVGVLQVLDGLRIDQLPGWATEGGPERPGGPQPAAPPAARTISFFLASSEEMRDDRDALDLYLRQQNDRLRKTGWYVKVIRWEYSLDAMSETRLQDEYNTAVEKADVFLALFKTKTGKYTEEEFDVAHRAFLDRKKPWIYTFFCKAPVSASGENRADLQSLWAFQDKLNELGHFWTEYEGAEGLKLQVKEQLERLIDAGRL